MCAKFDVNRSKFNVVKFDITVKTATLDEVRGQPSGHADQSSGRLQLDWKHEDVLKTSWCLLQGYVSIK